MSSGPAISLPRTPNQRSALRWDRIFYTGLVPTVSALILISTGKAIGDALLMSDEPGTTFAAVCAYVALSPAAVYVMTIPARSWRSWSRDDANVLSNPPPALQHLCPNCGSRSPSLSSGPCDQCSYEIDRYGGTWSKQHTDGPTSHTISLALQGSGMAFAAACGAASFAVPPTGTGVILGLSIACFIGTLTLFPIPRLFDALRIDLGGWSRWIYEEDDVKAWTHRYNEVADTEILEEDDVEAWIRRYNEVKNDYIEPEFKSDTVILRSRPCFGGSPAEPVDAVPGWLHEFNFQKYSWWDRACGKGLLFAGAVFCATLVYALMHATLSWTREEGFGGILYGIGMSTCMGSVGLALIFKLLSLAPTWRHDATFNLGAAGTACCGLGFFDVPAAAGPVATVLFPCFGTFLFLSAMVFLWVYWRIPRDERRTIFARTD